ncbi:unnamed protein product [Choristocarpus tenellus]
MCSLQGGIDYANGQGEMSPKKGPVHQLSFEEGFGDADSVMDWLLDLRLEELWPSFEAEGYTDMKRIKQQGLNATDLDKLQIRNPLHRRYLIDLGRCPFHTGLKISVVSYRTIGDIVMFKVVAEWRAWYSKTEKLYTDFNKLHNKLRRALKEANCPLMTQMPQLPGKGQVVQNQDPAFLLSRKTDLQVYLREVAGLVETQEPFFSLLCESLDLLSR